MARKISLAKLRFTGDKPRRSASGQSPVRRASPKIAAPRDRAGRAVHFDVLTPPMAPSVVRIQIRTPITPRAIREQYLAALADYPEAERIRLARARLTALDKHLGDDAASALEFYAMAEENCGRVKTGEWDGERVQTSGAGRGYGNEAALRMQAKHAFAQRRLSNHQRTGLYLFCQQMTAMRQAPKAAEAAWLLRLADKPVVVDRRAWHEAEKAWFGFLKSAGKDLYDLYATFENKTARAACL